MCLVWAAVVAAIAFLCRVNTSVNSPFPPRPAYPGQSISLMTTSSRVEVNQARQVVQTRGRPHHGTICRTDVTTLLICHLTPCATQGYNEFQYSLPRWEDLSLSRAGMYDDLYMHLPTQGWMFTPLVQYHSGLVESTTPLALPKGL
jgi:hypothetical protein